MLAGTHYPKLLEYPCYELNVCASQNSYVKTLPHNVIVFGGGGLWAEIVFK